MKKFTTIISMLIGFCIILSCNTPNNSKQEKYLSVWPEAADPVDIGNRITGNYLERSFMRSDIDSTLHYAEACTWYGALRFAKVTDNQDLKEKLIQRYQPLFDSANADLLPTKEHVDWTVWGIVPLEIFMQTGDSTFLPLGKNMADRQYENPDKDGRSRQIRFWIDDMFMISAIQTQAFRATGDTVYLSRAAHEMVYYLDTLQKDNGLFFHASRGRKIKRGEFHWGRGNGWMAAGLAILLKDLPESNQYYEEIMHGYLKMMEALLHHQDKDGMWHQLVDYPEAWPETSATAMFTYAMIMGVKNGWLPADSYGPAVRKAWIALSGYIDEDGKVRDVCKGMGIQSTADAYISAEKADGDLHGQAPVLWCISELI